MVARFLEQTSHGTLERAVKWGKGQLLRQTSPHASVYSGRTVLRLVSNFAFLFGNFGNFCFFLFFFSNFAPNLCFSITELIHHVMDNRIKRTHHLVICSRAPFSNFLLNFGHKTVTSPCTSPVHPNEVTCKSSKEI